MANIYNSQLDAFTLYHQYNDIPSSSTTTSTALPALGHAISGATGTAISNLCLYPLDLIITRLQVQRTLASQSSPSPTSASSQKYTSLTDAFEKIYKEEGGISGFYTGVLQDTSKSIADSFLFFLFYGYIRSKRLQSHHSSPKAALPALEELGVGALAGGLAKLFTTPLSQIVVRKQTYSLTSTSTSTSTFSRGCSSRSKPPSISSIISEIREKKGITGFWSGYSASLILTLNPSLTFFLFEFLKRFTVPRSKRDDPGAKITFLLAAVSKAVATSVTYPVSLAKARAQVDGSGSRSGSGSSSGSAGKKDSGEILDDVKGVTKNDSKKSAKKTKKHLHDISKHAGRNTIIHSLYKIYKEDGISGLYDGIGGEIIKGFLGHGLTMIIKDRVHGLVLTFYFMVLRLLKRGSSIEEIARNAKERIVENSEELASNAKEGGECAIHDLKIAGENTVHLQCARNTGSNFAAIAKDSATSIMQSASGIVDRAKDLGEKNKATFTNPTLPTLPITKEVKLNDRLGSTGENISEPTPTPTKTQTESQTKTQTTNEYINKEAGHLLGNAGEMLGERIEGVGGVVKRVGGKV